MAGSKIFKEIWIHLKARDWTWEEAFYFFQGHWRWYLYSGVYLKYLLKWWIREQIYYRLSVMNVDCYLNGECHLCGCETPQLQATMKGCPDCYPKMMRKVEWAVFKIVHKIKL